MSKYYRPFCNKSDKELVSEIKEMLQLRIGGEFKLTDKGIISTALKEYRNILKTKKELEEDVV